MYYLFKKYLISQVTLDLYYSYSLRSYDAYSIKKIKYSLNYYFFLNKKIFV